MGVLRAVQDGVFGLDQDINTILTSWRLDGEGFTDARPVTPRMLTSHTSGLGDGFGFPGYDPGAPLPTMVQLFEGQPPSNVRALFMEREPMTLMEYSGGGVTLMQQALSDARRRPFADIMRDDVLRPLGMTRSSYQQPIAPDNDRNAARAHSREGKAMGPKWHVYPELAAAGLWTTPSDLARFAIEVQLASAGKSERVLNRATAREMLTPVGVGDYAVGFSVQKIGQGWYFAHGGSNWGFRATLLAHFSNGYGLAIMTNADQGGAVMAELTRRIQAVYGWDAVAEPAPRGYRPPVQRPEVEVAAEILERYAGEYALAPGVSLVITLEEGRLHAQPTGQQKLVLAAESDETFNIRGVGAQIVFTRDAAGVVTGLVVRQGGSNQVASKIK